MSTPPPGAPADTSSSAGRRWLDLQGAVNVRDLGGLPLRAGGTTRTGVLLRADNLQDLTDRDVRALLDAGVTTVVDLRTDGEIRAEGPGPMAATGAHHTRHSFVPLDDVVAPAVDERVLPDRSGQIPQHVYLGYLREAPDEVVGAVRDLARAPGAVVFHCAAGKDRTGVLAALVESAVGVTPEAVLTDYLATGERIERIVARLASTPTYAADVTSRPVADHSPSPQALQGMLDELDAQWGGAVGWLLAHGLSEQDLELLRRRLT